MSGRPLVPSKDALRALRHLALSSPAAYFGTAGALCGVATLHYHASCKVRLAEKILERKRALHSISNGRGAARVALMFEAAENGDDFTLKRTRSWGPDGRRRHSATASQTEIGNDRSSQVGAVNTTDQECEFEPDNTRTQAPTIRRLIYEPRRQAHDRKDLRQNVRASISRRTSFNTHKDACYAEDSRKISQAPTTQPLEASASQTDGVPQRSVVPNRRYEWNTFVDTTRAVRNAVRHDPRIPDETNDGSRQTQTALMSSPIELRKGSVAQTASDLNPLPRFGQAPVTGAHAETEPELDLDTFYSSGINVFRSIQPWPQTEEQALMEQSSETDGITDTEPNADTNLYLRFGDGPSEVDPEWTLRSRYNYSIYRVRQSMKIIGSGRYYHVFHSILSCGHRHGRSESLKLLEHTMKLYIATGKVEDWAFAQALFLDCVLVFTTSEIKPMIWRIVWDFLRGDTPKLEVVALLYPRCGAGNVQRAPQFSYLARDYIQYVLEQVVGFDERILELRKLLAGTKTCNIPLDERLVIPILRRLCEAGRITQAQAVYDEVESVYGIKFSFYTKQELIKGYARVGNWSKVKAILDDGHQEGLSTSKVYGFGGLLTSIIDQFAFNSTADKTYQFVLHCVNAYGMQPVSGLSRKLIALALRHRRYDLVSAWTDMIIAKYPHIEIGTGSSTFAYDISRVWRDMQASCEDVYLGCQAMATHALRDPFSKSFRAIASETVSTYLSARLHKLRNELGLGASPKTQDHMDNLQEVISGLKAKADSQGSGSRAKLLLADLVSQAEALGALNALFRGEVQGEEHRYPKSHSRQAVPKPPAAHFELSTDPEDITSDLLAQYAEKEKLGLRIEHENLRDTVALLIRRGLHMAAFQLIDTVYKSRWTTPPTGSEFDVDLFADWIEIAWKLKSGNKLRSVLWALVESGPHVKFDSHLVLIARVAAPKTHLSRFKHARRNEIEEIEYLRWRLRSRREYQQKVDNIRFDTWWGLSGTEQNSPT